MVFSSIIGNGGYYKFPSISSLYGRWGAKITKVYRIFNISRISIKREICVDEKIENSLNHDTKILDIFKKSKIDLYYFFKFGGKDIKRIKEHLEKMKLKRTYEFGDYGFVEINFQ